MQHCTKHYLCQKIIKVGIHFKVLSLLLEHNFDLQPNYSKSYQDLFSKTFSKNTSPAVPKIIVHTLKYDLGKVLKYVHILKLPYSWISRPLLLISLYAHQRWKAYGLLYPMNRIKRLKNWKWFISRKSWGQNLEEKDDSFVLWNLTKNYVLKFKIYYSLFYEKLTLRNFYRLNCYT